MMVARSEYSGAPPGRQGLGLAASGTDTHEGDRKASVGSVRSNGRRAGPGRGRVPPMRRTNPSVGRRTNPRTYFCSQKCDLVRRPAGKWPRVSDRSGLIPAERTRAVAPSEPGARHPFNLGAERGRGGRGRLARSWIVRDVKEPSPIIAIRRPGVLRICRDFIAIRRSARRRARSSPSGARRRGRRRCRRENTRRRGAGRASGGRPGTGRSRRRPVAGPGRPS